MSARSMLLAATVTTVLSFTGAGALQAQYRVRYRQPPQPYFTITPYFGYAHFGHYINGPLGTSASGSGAALTGAQANLVLSPFISLVGNVAYGNTGLTFYVPSGEPTRGSSGVWLFDGDLQLTAPFRGAQGQIIKPFFQAGLGGVDYTTQNSIGNANSTSFAFNYGLGLDYPITRTVGLRLMAKDYVAHWNNPTVQRAGYYGPYYYNSGVFTHNFAVTSGLSLGF
jgi:hypothetical protein